MSGAKSWFQKLRDEYFLLPPDVPNAKPKPEGEGLIFDGCPGCKHPTTGQIIVVRCGACGDGPFPRLTLFFACDICGGSGVALGKWAQHVKTTHPAVTPSSLPR